jgi:hypothetical protein
MTIVALVILTTTVVYFWIKFNYQYSERRGIPGPEPTLLVGNFGPSFLLKSSLGHK